MTVRFLIALAILPLGAFAQIQDAPASASHKKKPKGTFYVSWGYNREWYGRTDIHFKNLSNTYNEHTQRNDYYEFTLHNVKASDRPDQDDLLHTPISIPQYNYRVGYFFGDKYDLGLEISFDHTKYVVDDYQEARVTGQINGQQIDQVMVLDPKTFVHFEHSDGANFLMLNLMKRQQLLASRDGRFGLNAVAKVGAGVVIPRTDVTLFGQELNNRFHIAGWVTGAEAGLRGHFFKYGFLEWTGKGFLANYSNVLVIGEGKAKHWMRGFETILTAGVQFPL